MTLGETIIITGDDRLWLQCARDAYLRGIKNLSPIIISCPPALKPPIKDIVFDQNIWIIVAMNTKFGFIAELNECSMTGRQLSIFRQKVHFPKELTNEIQRSLRIQFWLKTISHVAGELGGMVAGPIVGDAIAWKPSEKIAEELTKKAIEAGVEAHGEEIARRLNSLWKAEVRAIAAVSVVLILMIFVLTLV